MISEPICLYTDGSGSAGGGPGGWAAILVYGQHRRELSGGADEMKNNVAELLAVKYGLEAIKLVGAQVKIVTDSRNVIGWLYGWNTVTHQPDPACPFKRKDPAIFELCTAIESIYFGKQLQLSFEHIRGHRGHPENERCDQLAGEERQKRMAEVAYSISWQEFGKPFSCGLVAHGGKIVEAAPKMAWTIGKSRDSVLAYCRNLKSVEIAELPVTGGS